MNTRKLAIEIEREIEYWEYKESLNFDALRPAEKSRLANAYVQRGLLCAPTEQEKAIQDYTRAIELCPHLPAAYFYRGQSCLAQGEKVKGEADRLLAWLYAGSHAFHAGEKSEAKKYFRAIKQVSVATAILLHCELKLLKLGHEECIHGVFYYMEVFQPEINIDSACIFALANCYVENYSQTRIDLLKLRNLSGWLHHDVLDMLCDPRCWWAQSLPDEAEADKAELGELKSSLVGMMESLSDKALLLNAGLQSLCKSTVLGGLFHLQRGYFAPTIMRGRLERIARLLNDQALALPVQNLSATTIKALSDEQARNPSFKEMLEENYPQLYALVKPYFISAQCSPTLFALASTQENAAQTSGKRLCV